MTHENADGQPCCPKFDPAPWNGATLVWDNKPFILRTTPQLFHMPLLPLYKRTVARMWKQIQESGAAPPLQDFLLLAHDPSPWKSELYMAVTKSVLGAKNVALSGEFASRVFDGPPNGVPKWIMEMDAELAGRGLKAKKYYVYFTTCPRCARIYGHNYAVVLAEIG